MMFRRNKYLKVYQIRTVYDYDDTKEPFISYIEVKDLNEAVNVLLKQRFYTGVRKWIIGDGAELSGDKVRTEVYFTGYYTKATILSRHSKNAQKIYL